MAHYWIAALQSSRLTCTAEIDEVESHLDLLLDDRDVFDEVARLLALDVDPVLQGSQTLAPWLGSLASPPSASVRTQVMEAVGLPAAAYTRFQASPCDLPAELMERGSWLWALHNLLAPPEDQLWAAALEVRIIPVGDNGPPLLEIAAPSTFAVRLMVDLGVAAGGEREAGPIVDYFRERGDTWPEIAGSEDDTEGIVWSANIARADGPELAWTVAATVHPHWLPAITHLPFRSWAY